MSYGANKPCPQNQCFFRNQNFLKESNKGSSVGHSWEIWWKIINSFHQRSCLNEALHTDTHMTDTKPWQQDASFWLVVLTKGYPGTNCWACMTLTFDLSEWNLQMAHLFIMENKCANLYWNPSKIVGVTVRTKIWPSSVSVTLTLGLTEQMFEMAHLHVMENNCQIILKSIHNCSSYGPDKFAQTDGQTHAHGCMHTKLLLKQLCLAHHKQARQKQKSTWREDQIWDNQVANSRPLQLSQCYDLALVKISP